MRGQRAIREQWEGFASVLKGEEADLDDVRGWSGRGIGRASDGACVSAVIENPGTELTVWLNRAEVLPAKLLSP